MLEYEIAAGSKVNNPTLAKTARMGHPAGCAVEKRGHPPGAVVKHGHPPHEGMLRRDSNTVPKANGKAIVVVESVTETNPMNEHFEMNIPGKFNPLEESILDYLYDHPDDEIGTESLAQALKPEQFAAGVGAEIAVCDEVQNGIETLIAANLVRGKRIAPLKVVEYSKLRLTPKGEAEAIKQRRRDKKLIVSVKNIGGESPKQS